MKTCFAGKRTAIKSENRSKTDSRTLIARRSSLSKKTSDTTVKTNIFEQNATQKSIIGRLKNVRNFVRKRGLMMRLIVNKNKTRWKT